METYGHQGNFNWSSWNSFRPQFKKLACFFCPYFLAFLYGLILDENIWVRTLPQLLIFVACPSLDQSSKNVNVTWRSWGNRSLQWSKTLYHYTLRHYTKKCKIFFIWKIGQRHNSDWLFINKRDDWYKVNPNPHGGGADSARAITYLLTATKVKELNLWNFLTFPKMVQGS